MPRSPSNKPGKSNSPIPSGRKFLSGVLSGSGWVIFLLSLSSCAYSDALGRYLNPPQSAPITETPLATPPVILTQMATLPSACRQTAGKVERISFESADLKQEFTASVYTPACYDPSAGDYPVLYLLHGQNQDDQFWYDLGAAGVADQAIQSGRKPFLMVMPYEVDNFAAIPDSKFGAALIDDLIPYIEGHYSVCKLQHCRAIGGISRGGGWAVHLALLHIDLFASVGAHSPGVFSGDSSRVDRLRKTLAPQEFPRFYIDRGEKDFLQEEIDSFDTALTRNDIVHEYLVQPGSHTPSYWEAHLAEYLQWYMDGWNPQG